MAVFIAVGPADGELLTIRQDVSGSHVIQPLDRLRPAGMILRSLKTLQRSGVNAPVEGGVIGTHVIPEHPIELRQGSDGTDIKSIEPTFLQGTEMAFHLALAGTVTDLCVKKQHPDGDTDHGQLFIRVTAAVVNVELVRDAMPSDRTEFVRSR